MSLYGQVGVDAIGLLRVDVTDTGVGIDQEDQHRVFGEFNQFNRNDLQGGGCLFSPIATSLHNLILTDLS